MAVLERIIDKGLLAEFLAGLKGLFATKDVATASAAGLMSAADKAKLDGLSGSGGSEELMLALLSGTRELEDLSVQGGEFENAGEGWNTFEFPEPFDAPPLVLAQCEGYGVDVKGVTAERFLYMVTQATSSSGSSRTLYYGKSNQYGLSGIVATSDSAGYSLTNQGSFTVLTAGALLANSADCDGDARMPRRACTPLR